MVKKTKTKMKKTKMKKSCNLPNLVKTTMSSKLYKKRVNINKKKGIMLKKNSPNGKYVYVISKKKPLKVIMIDKRIERKDYIYHNILSEDGNVLIAGEMEIKDNLVSFDNNSGHYKPKVNCFDYLKDLMINIYGFKYDSTNKKQLKHFLKTTMVFDRSNVYSK
tara:strand:- start:7740 stop:8228 length:489 start_codon:yes stop_codon:yes gene_type:complete